MKLTDEQKAALPPWQTRRGRSKYLLILHRHGTTETEAKIGPMSLRSIGRAKKQHQQEGHARGVLCLTRSI